jgi:uncharacterized protein
MMRDESGVVIRSLSLRASQLDVTSDLRLRGYAVVFNQLSQDLGGWKERIAPSAVDRTLKSGANVDALQDHMRTTSTILGSTDTGLLTLRKDQHGLSVDIRPPDTQNARDLVAVVKSGLAKGMSFAFRTMQDGTSWDQEGEDIVRTVTDMEFYEVSVVVNPAYPSTEVSARSMALDRAAFEEFRSLAKWKPSLKMREQMLRASL